MLFYRRLLYRRLLYTYEKKNHFVVTVTPPIGKSLRLIDKAESCSRATQGIHDNRGHRIHTDMDQGFYAILGSSNGKVVMHMLKDHEQHIRGRYVEKVVVLGTKAQKQELYSRNMCEHATQIRSSKREPCVSAVEFLEATLERL